MTVQGQLQQSDDIAGRYEVFGTTEDGNFRRVQLTSGDVMEVLLQDALWKDQQAVLEHEGQLWLVGRCEYSHTQADYCFLWHCLGADRYLATFQSLVELGATVRVR